MVSSTSSDFLRLLTGKEGSSAAGTSGPLRSIGEHFTQALRESLESAAAPADGRRIQVQEAEESLPAKRGNRLVVSCAEPGVARQSAAETGEWKTMLEGNLTQDELSGAPEPAALLNGRLESVRGASSAIVRNSMDSSGQALSASWLSSKDQAGAVLAKLQSLGMKAGEIEELQMTSGPFAIEYGDDRRSFLIGGMNVMMLLERYAKYPAEVADQMTMDELRAMG
ncbi:MAG: hypothetical protein KIT09_14755 [Bryobacteraceae bacterium]|nr:hypothetical protein [Bryobacteraceae bacterium]